ncbi:MAG: hypothetical protein EXQ95_07800 [Alphaproteobacteria bacterium]|nr:hypothetical protein [Alphaproteobacteria bacterium]
MFAPRLDILPESQRALWPRLRPATALGMVLYGGTAIALRLGHRQSLDFDFFTDRPLDVAAIYAALPFLQKGIVVQQTSDTLTVLIQVEHVGKRAGERPVKLSFLGGLGFGRIGLPEMTDDGVLQVASMDDLMATKLKVMLQRVEAKDYRDIAAMLEAGVRLDKGLAAARLFYGSQFQPSESLKAMTYFKGGDLDTLSDDERRRLIAASTAVGDLPRVDRIGDTLSVAAP